MSDTMPRMSPERPHTDSGSDYAAPRSKWEEYERRKASLQDLDLSAEDYEYAISRIAEQLGI